MDDKTNAACLLHKSKLEDFKEYLLWEDIPFRDGKGQYQVLQVWTPRGWRVIFECKDAPEHLSLNRDLVPLVREFLNDQKKKRGKL